MPVDIVRKPINLANRVKELKIVKASDLTEHPYNWRGHPAGQMELLRHSIERFGIANPLLAYHSSRNGGKLTLFDGHARLSLPEVAEWPVIIVDMDDDEADTMLMLVDPISALATTEKDNLLTLAANSDVIDPVIAAFCLNMANEQIAPPKEPKNQSWPTISITLPPDEFQQWLVIVMAHDKDAVEAFKYLLNNIDPMELPQGDTTE